MARTAPRSDPKCPFSQVETDDGWSGWVTADAVAGGHTPGGLLRALHCWHVRWS
ncbi:MAG: hypothetical protein M3535_03905 [Actinomycetota bacterium]|nr:hypothetical protein [Actinomycetota bacterium]